MSKTIHTLLTLVLALCVCGTSYGQADRPAAEEKTATFRFVAGDNMFYIPWSGNDAELERLCAMVDEYRTEIAAGAMPVYVDGYCASLPTVKENLRTAFVRANRVKSELIMQKGLKEADFITKNYARAYHDSKDIVVVTLRIPAKETPKPQEAVQEEPRKEEPPMEVVSRPEAEPQPAQEPVAEAAFEPLAVQPAISVKPYTLAVRSNLLYDALLLPTLGVEWRVNENIGIKLDGSLSWWGSETDKVQKMWILNPEVRWYLLDNKHFYVGVSGSYGQYNIYKYPLGNLLKDDTGYQGSIWGAGVTVGYQLYLSRCFSVDFNLGLGYTHSEYDSFTIIDKVRVTKERNQSKNFWGPTQAGISLVWTIGGNK